MSNVPPANSSSPPLMSSKGSNSPSGAKSNNGSNKKPNSGNNTSSPPGNSHSEPQGDARTLLGELWEWENPTTGETERWFKQTVAPFDFIYMGIANDETEKSMPLEKRYK